MYQIDRRVGLQQVAPGPLAGIGLARDQQHAQPVADAVDRNDGLIVEIGQLTLGIRYYQLHDVWPGMVQLDLDADLLTGLDVNGIGSAPSIDRNTGTIGRRSAGTLPSVSMRRPNSMLSPTIA